MNRKYLKSLVILIVIILSIPAIYNLKSTRAAVVSGSIPNSLPSIIHPMMFGYYFVDSNFGSYFGEVKDYTNTMLIGAADFFENGHNDQFGFDGAFQDAISGKQKVFYGPGSNWDNGIAKAVPYWSSIDMIYLADEPNWNKTTAESQISTFKVKVTASGLAQKPIAINFTDQQILTGTGWQANNLDVVEFEAYVDPAQQNDPNLVQNLNNRIGQIKQRIGNKKMFIVIQGYDRNGAWNNLNSLIDIQIPPYLASYNDNNVIGLFIFSYARKGGTRDLGVLTQTHQLIGETILGTAPLTIQITNATPGWLGDLAFSTKNNAWLVVSNGGGISGRFMDTNGNPNGNAFRISPINQDGTYTPSVAYSPDINKFLVVWNSFPGPSGPNGGYGRFVSPDGTMGNAFNLNIGANPWFNIGAQKTSSLKYDSRNKRFVLIWHKPGGGPLLTTIDLNGNIGQIIDLSSGNGGGNWNPKIAINEDKNEYCAIYDQRNTGKWAMRTVNASNFSLGPESAVSLVTSQTDIAYNSITKQYMAIYNDNNGGTSGRILNSCNASDMNGGQFMVLPGVFYARITFNSKSNTFGVIGQNQTAPGSNYIVLDSNGNQLTSGTFLTASPFGQYVQTIAANSNSGTFSAITDENYATTQLMSNIGAGIKGVIAPPFGSPIIPAVPSQGLPTNLGSFIQQLFLWSLTILGISVFVMFFYAGFLWLTAQGNVGQTTKARKIMINALIGAAILLLSYLILYTLNPDLVKQAMNLPGL